MANRDNPATGAKFELQVQEYFRQNKIILERPYTIDIGVHNSKKTHKFDLGSQEEMIVVECKAHTWTKTGNTPSEKMSVWNEAMDYFFLAPSSYSKLFFFKKSLRKGESLGQYYLKSYLHLIPANVEFWEFCAEEKKANCLFKNC